MHANSPSCLRLFSAIAAVTIAAFAAQPVAAQTFGFATMQPGTGNHTAGSAIAKVLKEKAGLNTLVQPTAGESVIIAIVGRGEAEFGMANAPEIGLAMANNGQPNLRMVGVVYTIKTGFWVRKSTDMRTIADLKGKRVTLGFSAMRALDPLSKALLASGGLSEKDVSAVLVPNVIRSADEFVAGNSDMYMFAFGTPKIREVEASVGGTRLLDIPASPGIAAARKISAFGYLSDAAPGPNNIGVEKPMKVYTIDNILFTHAKVSDDAVYKALTAMAANRTEMSGIAAQLAEFSESALYKRYDFPYHPGALKYFKDRNLAAKSLD
jgi:TRAP transporter TAXI family solute receptor